MIITAKIACGISNQNLNKKSFRKSEIRQLRKIERRIIREAKKGRLYVEYYNDLYDSVIEVLKKNGYTVKDCGTYDYERFIIYWNKES